MSPQFIESFVETCMDMGLSKEATAELLQHRSVIHAAEQSPAFAEGYLNATSGTAVRVRPGYVEKRAFGAALRAIGGGLGGVVKGVGGIGMSAGRGLVNAAMKNPRTAKALAGGTAAAATGYGINEYLNKRYEAPGVPYMAPGGYNPDEEKKEYDNEINRFSRGIGEANKTIDGSAARRRVLQQAVDSNSPNSAQALADLKLLDKTVGSAKSTKDKHMEQLKQQGATTSSRLADITAQQQKYRDRSKSPFWRGLHRATFQDPDKAYGDALEKLQPQAAELSRQNQLIKDQTKRMPYWMNQPTNIPSSAQLQREFFPAAR